MGNPLDLLRNSLNKNRAGRWNRSVVNQRALDEGLRPTTVEGWKDGQPIIRSLGGQPINTGRSVTNGSLPLGPVCADYADGAIQLDGVPFLAQRAGEEEETVAITASVTKYGMVWLVHTITELFEGNGLTETLQSLKVFYKENNLPSVLVYQRNWAYPPFRPGYYVPSFFAATCHLIDGSKSFVEVLLSESRYTDIDIVDIKVSHYRYYVRRGSEVEELPLFQVVDETGETPFEIKTYPTRSGAIAPYIYGDTYSTGTYTDVKSYFVPTIYQRNVSRDFIITDLMSPLSYRFVPSPSFVSPPEGYYWRELNFNTETVAGEKIYAPVAQTPFKVGGFLRTGAGAYDFSALNQPSSIDFAITHDITNGDVKQVVFPASTAIEIWEVQDKVLTTEASSDQPWNQKEGFGRKIQSLDFIPGEDEGLTAPSDLLNSDINRQTNFVFSAFKVGIFR